MGQVIQHRRIVPRFLFGRQTARLALGGIAISLVAAACSGGTSSSTKTSTSTARGVDVSAVQSAGHGTILVSGNTLYILKTPSQTACAAECLKIWPELVLPAGLTAAVAGAGVDATKLGTVARGSALQVTYAGQPLYYFSQDAGPGQVTGNITDVWGTWSDIAITGPAAAAASIPSSAPGSSTTRATGTTGTTRVTALPGTTTAPGVTLAPGTTATTRTTQTSRTTAITAPPTTAPPTTAPPTTAPPTTAPPTTATTTPPTSGF